MSVAAETREAAREHPFLLTALRAGVVNYQGAAAFLDVDGDPDAVATALRRFADDLSDLETADRDVRVRMESGVGLVPAEPDAADEDAADAVADEDADDADPALLRVGDHLVRPDEGSLTAVVATGEVDAAALTAALGRLRAAEISPEAAAIAGDALTVVVPRRAGARAVRTVEAALAAVPE